MTSRFISPILVSFGLLVACALPGIAQASDASFVKFNATARSGACTPRLSAAEAEAVLRRNNVRSPTASPAETMALARGIRQLELLSGGRPSPYATGVTFVFNTEKNYSQQYANRIVMSRNNSAGTANVGYLMHELGHQAGNRGLYAAYKKAVPSRKGTAGRCMVTSYCGKDYAVHRERNEEFAEVWAAYITNPAMLKAKGGPCLAAYNFFQSKVFPNGQATPCHGKGAGGGLASWQPGGSADPNVCIDERPNSRGNWRDIRALGERIGDSAHAQENARGAKRCGFWAALFGTCKYGTVLSP